MNILNKHASSLIEEITVNFGNKCNLDCDFCNVTTDHTFDYDITYDSIVEKGELVCQCIKSSPKHSISVVLMGGELFHDGIDQHTFQGYRRFLEQVRQTCKQTDKYVTISLMTNLIYKNVERVIDLALRYQCEIHGSFDFRGRFKTEREKQLWYTNARKIKQAGLYFFVSMVGHKFNIQTIMSGNQEWDSLYKEFGCYVQYYEPIKRNDEYQISLIEYSTFLKWLVDYYPNEKFLYGLLEGYRDNTPLCLRSILIDRTVHKCCDHDKLVRKMILNKQCFSCRYMNKCPVNCPRTMSDGSHCVTKEVLQYVESKSL